MRVEHCFIAGILIIGLAEPTGSLAAERAARSRSRPLTQHQRYQEYKKSTFGRRALVTSGAGNALSYSVHHSKDWGHGASGMGKYWGAHLGESVVKNTLQFGIASWRHEDDRFVPSTKHGALPRLGDAVVHTFYVPRTTGGKTPAYARVGGSLGAGMISRAWFPGALHTASAGAASGGMLVGADVAQNVVREFWPDIRKHTRRRKT